MDVTTKAGRKFTIRLSIKRQNKTEFFAASKRACTVRGGGGGGGRIFFIKGDKIKLWIT